MAEDTETPPLEEEIAEVTESKGDIFLKEARKAKAEAGIRSEYVPDETLNERVDGYIDELTAEVEDDLTDEQKELLGTVMFTTSEKAGGADWVSEGEHSIDDKMLDSLRLAGLLTIDEIKGKKQPLGLRQHTKYLRDKLGDLPEELRQSRLDTIENWRNNPGRTPLELKAYEEWKRRNELVEKYNERLKLSESWEDRKKEKPEEKKKDDEYPPHPFIMLGGFLRRKYRDFGGVSGFGYTPREEGTVSEEEAKGEARDSGLSRIYASLVESGDYVKWGNARLTRQRSKLEERIEGRLEGEAEAEPSEAEVSEGQEPTETVEEEEKVEVEEEDLPKEEKDVLKDEEDFMAKFEEKQRELQEKLQEKEISPEKAMEELVNFLQQEESKPAKEKREKPELTKEDEIARNTLRRLLKDPIKAFDISQKLVDGDLTLEEFSENIKNTRARNSFIEGFRRQLEMFGYSKEDLKAVPANELIRMFNESIGIADIKDWDTQNKKVLAVNILIYIVSTIWGELEQGAKEGVAGTTQQ